MTPVFWILWNYCVDFFDCGLAVLISHRMLAPCERGRWIPPAFAALTALILYGIHYFSLSIFYVMLFVMLFFSYNMVMFRDPVGYKIFWPVFSHASCLTLHSLIGSALMLLFPALPTRIDTVLQMPGAWGLLHTVLSRALFAALLAVVSTKGQSFRQQRRQLEWCLLCGVILCSGVSVSLLLRYIYQCHALDPTLLGVVCGILFLTALSVAIVIILTSKSNRVLSHELKSSRTTMQRKQMGQDISTYRSLHAFSLNFLHHMRILHDLYLSGDSKALGSYLETLQALPATGSLLVVTGNEYVDAILNAKLNYAKENRIHISLDIRLTDLKPVTSADLTAMLGNILDNAIEANLKLPNPEDRFLHFGIFYNSDYGIPFCIVDCRNASAGTPLSEGHGQGLRQIKSIIEKYEGFCHMQNDASSFSIEVMIPLSSHQTALQVYMYDMNE